MPLSLVRLRRSKPVPLNLLLTLALLLGLVFVAPLEDADAAPASPMGLPERVVAGYWTYWGGPALGDLPADYNTVYLFSARPVGGQPGSTGAVYFDQGVQSSASFVDDIATLRGQGRAVILSVGGAGEYLNIGTQAREDAFVASIRQIYTQLGGFDGLDWNIESSDLPVSHMVSASRRLKQEFGEGFAITTPPAPWRQAEKDFVVALRQAGALDLVTPQYYDLTGLATEGERRQHALDNIAQWVEAAGGADKVGFGFRTVGPATETMTVDSVGQVLSSALERYPNLGGAMVWSVELDRGIGYGFASEAARVLGSPTVAGGSGSTATGTFRDVTSAQHRDAIERMSDDGVLQGYPDGTFKPAGSLTRGQLATIMSRALELDGDSCSTSCAALSDIDGSTHEDGIQAVVAAGFVAGYPDGTFRPNRPVTRGQMAAFLSGGFQLSSVGAEHPFTDVVGTTHESAIATIFSAGITVGRTASTFEPHDQVRRDQAATFLDRASAQD